MCNEDKLENVKDNIQNLIWESQERQEKLEQELYFLINKVDEILKESLNHE